MLTTTTESTTTTPAPTTTTATAATTTTPEPAPQAENGVPGVEGSTHWMEYPADDSQTGGSGAPGYGNNGNSNAEFLGPNLGKY